MAWTKEQYERYLATLSEEQCGLAPIKNGTRTIRECNPPTENGRTCGICGKYLYTM